MTEDDEELRATINLAEDGSLVLAMLFDGCGPAEILRTVGVDNPRGLNAQKQIFFDVFADPKLYAEIKAWHAKGHRLCALIATYLNEYEWEHGLPPSIPEWREGEADDLSGLKRDLAKMYFATKHGHAAD